MTPGLKTEPKVHSIAIHQTEKGFDYSTPDRRDAVVIYVRRGEAVKWNCDNGNYTILFKGESPFTEVAVHARKGQDTVHSVVTAPEGSYKYAVTIALPDGGLITDDPEIIVGP